MPSGAGAPPVELRVPFGEELVHYAVGPGHVRGAGLAARARRPARALRPAAVARELVEPALGLARARRDDAPRPRRVPRDAGAGLHDAAATAARIYAPEGRPLEAGEHARPARARRDALELLAAEGADSPYRGSIAESLLSASRGSRCRAPTWRATSTAGSARPRSAGRAIASSPAAGSPASPRRSSRLPPLRELDGTARVHALLAALDGPGAEGHTTNLVTADSDGNACVLTSSLGLGTGDFLPGLDLHLNSMLGEVDLVLERRSQAGERMQSMMAPSLALDERGLALAIGSAGGTRLRTALVGVAAGILDEGSTRSTRSAGPLPPRRRGRQRRARRRRAGAGGARGAPGLHVRRWPRSITTSAASACCRAQALPAIRGGAVTPRRFPDRSR